VIVRTGTANLASVRAGLSRVGAQAEVSDDPTRVEAADHVVLPGVGAFAAAMDVLRQKDMIPVLKERIDADRSTLAICLGLQLLGTGSEESPDTEGLGVVSQVASRFAGTVRVPQLGWNRVIPSPEARLLESGWAYFANSYRWTAAPTGWESARSDHGGPFVAAVERGPVLACQFHPELSGAWGQALLRRWLGVESPGREDAAGAKGKEVREW
jgi:imidazole glycerol phosphate synthase glutamine amidotransferase subunit